MGTVLLIHPDGTLDEGVEPVPADKVRGREIRAIMAPHPILSPARRRFMPICYGTANQIARVSVGIFRKAALWNLCRLGIIFKPGPLRLKVPISAAACRWSRKKGRI